MVPLIPILYLISFSLLVYRIANITSKKEAAILAAFIVFGAALALYQSTNALLFVSIVILFDLITAKYGSREGLFFVVLGFAYFIVSLYSGIAVYLIAQAMLLGLAPDAILKGLKAHKVSSKKTETSRDIVQIAFGILVIAMFHFLRPELSESVMITLILLGYLAVNYGIVRKETNLAKRLYALEREYTSLGEGATWLALGSLAAIGFVFHVKYMMIIFSAIFIADALATIIGIRAKGMKLPYNKKKSAAGTIAYFAVVAIIPYLLYGVIALPVAIIAAFVESLPLKLDDNLSVPVVLVVLHFLLRFLQ
ncbi:MAG: hypothetical protein KGH61_02850 [Candidatus Micrarchaeota archaeon]|nr:hypothetical protein [Candidatus Micrarchaeota archaeon]MDE1847863.1 hypothetical protein [Candidatus Micrarchaeota archaeon]MDE1864190.1 hypothetical protein [Candidatus Micrarchaeota archaeon]